MEFQPKISIWSITTVYQLRTYSTVHQYVRVNLIVVSIIEQITPIWGRHSVDISNCVMKTETGQVSNCMELPNIALSDVFTYAILTPWRYPTFHLPMHSLMIS